MSEILEMIKNENVEWKKLGEMDSIRIVSPKKKIKKKDYLNNGKYPIIDQGQKFIIGYTNDKDAIFDINSYIIFGDHTEVIKYVNFPFAQGADGIKILKTDENFINSRYLYHAILNFYEVTGNYKRHFSMLKKTKIPIPPLKTQEKIVEILDNFVKYSTELQAELQNRNKQYEYYRNLLLSEKYLNKLADSPEIIGGGYEKLRIYNIEDITKIKNGKDWKKLNSGDIPVYGSGGYMNVSVDKYVYNKPTVLIPRKGSIENIFYLDEPFWNVDTIFYTEIDETKIIPKYLYYFMKTLDLKSLSTNITRPSLTQTVLNKVKIKLPSLKIQNKVVEVLDKFQDLIANAEGLLPEEIAQRQKQYEYYREKLLTFENNMVKGKASSTL